MHLPEFESGRRPCLFVYVIVYLRGGAEVEHRVVFGVIVHRLRRVVAGVTTIKAL